MRNLIGTLLLCGAMLGTANHARAGIVDHELRFDPERSNFGFQLSTRWGQKLVGRFPRFDGRVLTLADGRHQVELRMYTRDVEILDHPRYSRWARGDNFFGAEAWPAVVFVSRPYDPAILRNGGPLAGELNIRGIARAETLEVQPAACARAGLDCDIVATGAVLRSDYDMGAFGLAINDRVVFVLRSRLREAPLEPSP